MNKTRHKYFRNSKYKRTLLSKYYNGQNRHYPSNIVFISKEKSSNQFYPPYVFWSDSHNRYEYYHKPDVQFSIIEKNRSFSKKYYRTCLNRKLRHNEGSRYLKEYKRNEYRRLYELQWWID